MIEKARVRILINKIPGASTAFGVTALRIVIAPLLLYTILVGLGTWAEGLLFLACATDLIDGYLARKLGVVSDLGAYFDVTADFLVIMAAFIAFVIMSIYPFWLLAVVTIMFGQFMITSKLGRPFYDLIGRYYGTFLFISIGMTLAFLSPVLCLAMPSIVLALTFASVASRCIAAFQLAVPLASPPDRQRVKRLGETSVEERNGLRVSST